MSTRSPWDWKKKKDGGRRGELDESLCCWDDSGVGGNGIWWIFPIWIATLKMGLMLRREVFLSPCFPSHSASLSLTFYLPTPHSPILSHLQSEFNPNLLFNSLHFAHHVPSTVASCILTLQVLPIFHFFHLPLFSASLWLLILTRSFSILISVNRVKWEDEFSKDSRVGDSFDSNSRLTICWWWRQVGN